MTVTSSMRSFRLFFSTALLCAASALAQQPATAPANKADLSVEARLVIVPTVVRDKKGALINTLHKEDFALQVDGKPQALRYFDHDTEVPLTMGLLVDTSMSQREALDSERTASTAFLEKMLVPSRDKAFVIQFAHTVELLQDVTDSRPKLQQAIKEIDSEKPSFDRNDNSGSGSNNGGGRDDSDNDRRGGGGRRRDFGNGGTALYDAVFLASDEVMAKQKGRRAIVLLTDGDDRGSKVSLTRAIESAQRANVIVYAIYFKGQSPRGDRQGGFPGGGRRRGGGFPFPLVAEGGNFQRPGGGGGYGQIDGKKVLERMCGETGGRVFEVSKKQTVDAIYTQIAEELRAQYRLGFTPTAESASDGYHQLNLTLNGPADKNKNTVQTRDGYYTGSTK